LGFSPERHNGKSYIHWYCKETGDVLDTVELTSASTEEVQRSESGNVGDREEGKEEEVPDLRSATE
jgi:hypothetical protein